MDRYQEPKVERSEKQDEESGDAQGLAAQYMQYLTDSQAQAKPEQQKPQESPEEKTEKEPEAVKLASGDSLVQHGLNDFLILSDGSKLAIINDIEVENDLPVPLDQRLLMQDKDGKFVGIKYVGTKTSIPPIDEYRFANGMTASVSAGLARIEYPNGDRIYVDDLGLVAVHRKAGRADIREPITQPVEEMIVPKPPPREL